MLFDRVRTLLLMTGPKEALFATSMGMKIVKHVLIHQTT